jgi:Zn ribbon nucleic-acid-binding protein
MSEQMAFTVGPSLTDAQHELKEKLETGVSCPCCGQFAKLYKRQIHSTMALALISFYRMANGKTEGYFHIKQLLESTRISMHRLAGGDFAKLSIWGLIEEKQKSDSGHGRTSGFWQLTQKGADFVRGVATVPQYVFLYNDSIKGWSENVVSISECLNNKFDYNDLMRGL